MSGFGLQGILPSDSFTSLTALTSLDLYNNFLTSPLPSMSKLTKLHALYAKFNLLMEDKKNPILFLHQLHALQIQSPSRKPNLSDNSCFTIPKSLFIIIIMAYIMIIYFTGIYHPMHSARNFRIIYYASKALWHCKSFCVDGLFKFKTIQKSSNTNLITQPFSNTWRN